MAMNEMLDYGFNVIIKEYARFPNFLSLPCHWEHGWSLSLPLNTDLATNKPLMLVFSKRRERAWKEKSHIPVAVMGAPFVHYRRMRNIKKDENAKGTVAFPSHSCYGIESIFDINKYCEELRKLPDDFQPVTICLHIDDVNTGKGDIFKKQGFDFFTAGNRDSAKFPSRFYNILKIHKYSTSNTIGTHTFYSVEMDIPFFILGEINLFNNYNDPNAPKGRYSILYDEIGRYTYNLFNTKPVKYITQEQLDFVLSEVGVNDCLCRNEMNKTLWKYKAKEIPLMIRRIPARAYMKFRNFLNKR